MQISGATALVTGANRGLGRQFAIELHRRGAKVYATARRPEQVDVPGVEALRLDITDQSSVEEVAATAGDVDLLINNAAFTGGGNFLTGDPRDIRETMESNYFGTLAMIRAFAPVLARNGGGAVLNVLSGVAWQTVVGNTSYAAAKSAEWSLTNGVRIELADQGTLVSALVPGLIDTPTLREFCANLGVPLAEAAMVKPAELVKRALDGIEQGEIEILDRVAASMKAALPGPPVAFDLVSAASGS
ncbi:SDR family NAD(P)-dependent oxidoreductase [Kineosporia sp. J2-2]|uniref:SDR family NAD(P)-dependent oxidoreductase n=1 Tax=Kineosporia corallincola TaxID=2835133 RepID=A0ABS5TGF6_9ACTN|nr:SDR family NAD(P)-dependent oxidoreductase [Kineosporia corallincola]MBT0768684.1 SDR family NAD(P)-dependent oxidoreductase [Kineosporia corallincola]